MSGAVYELRGHQRDAVDPRECVWLSASAGTGKTQVLSARVLRLLLRPDTDPAEILCLTFTKAGAAEMATRVNAVLARWVRLPETDLSEELSRLGAPISPETRQRARSLFAAVLDCPGGGLRIDTIHAFAQYLLGSFPEEAQLPPNVKPMEDRERDLLSRRVLTELIEQAQQSGDQRRLDALADISRRHGPEAVMGWMMRCASAQALWDDAPRWQPPFRERLAMALDMPANADEAWAAEAVSDAIFPADAMRALLTPMQNWSAAGGAKAAEFIAAWLARDPLQRLETLSGFYDTLLTKSGMPRVMKKPAASDPSVPDHLDAIAHGIIAANERVTLLALLDRMAPALDLGHAFAVRWDEAKQREGLIDFDDQIRRAGLLLQESEMAGWIRFKLDRQFDHILIDEAQDTNADQWAIINALIDDFFDGQSAHEGKVRTIFTVGDYKQAIFGFQGTSPDAFRTARNAVHDDMEAAATNAEQMAGAPPPRRLQNYDLAQSFRTASPILEFVDNVIESIGPQELGLTDRYERHVGEDRPGAVTLWNTVTAQSDDSADEDEQNWLAHQDRVMADHLATQISDWLREGHPLVKGEKWNAQAGDIMVLVRKRKELAGLIVARLQAAGVPVAGVDRLRIGNPLAVKDLMAAIRFAAQPFDDLTLANVLVSPLGGWSQTDLLELGHRPKNVALWNHLRDSDDPRATGPVAMLRQLLDKADFEPPMALLHWVLTGPMEGRRKLTARLGSEANDPIDELLNAASAYAASHTVSLQGFIRWFDAGDGEIKREAEGSGNQVRVMTVHGSKGLQAPIVILADAAGRPGAGGALALPERRIDGGQPRDIPLLPIANADAVGPLASLREKAEADDLEEHWRLLYVAMTRAEEALYIGGSLSPRDKGEAHPDSWYARAKSLFAEDDALSDAVWGSRWVWGEAPPAITGQTSTAIGNELSQVPQWARNPVGDEPRPPRPLAPSALGDNEAADPPLRPAEAMTAARRGVLIHALLERLPSIPIDARTSAADQWLAKRATDFDEAARREMRMAAIAVLQDERFADVFSPDALAEVPFSAIVGGQVVAGTVDRLLIEATAVTVLDFKTTRRPPETLADIPAASLRQIAAYHSALEVIYPQREVRVGLLYTQAPALFMIEPAQLDAHKRAFLS